MTEFLLIYHYYQGSLWCFPHNDYFKELPCLVFSYKQLTKAWEEAEISATRGMYIRVKPVLVGKEMDPC